MVTTKITELENGFNLYEIKVPDSEDKIDFYVECSDKPIHSSKSFIQFFEVATDEHEALFQLQKKWLRLHSEIFEQVKSSLEFGEQQMTEMISKLKK